MNGEGNLQNDLTAQQSQEMLPEQMTNEQLQEAFRNQLPPAQQSPRSKLVLIGSGTALAVLAAAVLIQVLKTENLDYPKTAAADTSGPARISKEDASNPTLARIQRGNQYIVVRYDEVARECVARVGEDVLENIVNRTIIKLACEEDGVVVTESEVDQEIIKITEEFNIAIDEWYQMLQSERNLTPIQYRRDVIWPMLALRKLAVEEVTVSERDIEKAFLRNYGRRVRARMIMLGNLRHANEVWKQVDLRPDDFELLARKHSIEPNSRALDGAIPPIPMYSGSAEIEKVAFKLKQGEVSGIIHIGMNRYVILKCEGYTDPVPVNKEQVRAVLHQEIMKEKVQESASKVFDRVKKQARVDNYLTNTVTGNIKQTSGTTSGRPSATPSTGKSRTSTIPGRLPPKTSPQQRQSTFAPRTSTAKPSSR
ncbi:MAG: peptidylprolyl isomerase [Planctomycetaceae bacterium]|nr:peptidylprolyl isomerase [Planctomycetaceae bacterium]